MEDVELSTVAGAAATSFQLMYGGGTVLCDFHYLYCARPKQLTVKYFWPEREYVKVTK